MNSNKVVFCQLRVRNLIWNRSTRHQACTAQLCGHTHLMLLLLQLECLERIDLDPVRQLDILIRTGGLLGDVRFDLYIISTERIREVCLRSSPCRYVSDFASY